ncbi:DUF2528 family protein [Escherichia coli]|nr:DUF2528 family protein [Escherichia coli]
MLFTSFSGSLVSRISGAVHSLLNAVLIMLAQHALLIAISSDLNAYGVVCEFDWNDGNGQEGWPPMDGSEGIRITDIDTSGIFDSDDMTIKAA